MHRHFLLTVAGCLLWHLTADTVAAQTEYGVIQGMYRQYLQRDPGRDEVLGWVRAVQNGTPLEEVQASLLASDEYFNRFRRSPPAFVNGLYQDVLGRPAEPTGQAEWVKAYNGYRGRRDRLVRDFLQKAQAELQVRPPFRPPPGGSVFDQLAAQAGQLAETVTLELGGSAQGRQVLIRANALASTARLLQGVMADPAATPARQQAALQGVVNAYEATRSALLSVPGSAPGSARLLAGIGTTLAQVQGGVNPPVGDQRIDRALDRLRRDVADLLTVLGQATRRSYFYEALERDLSVLEVQVDALRRDYQSGSPDHLLRAGFRRLARQADQTGHGVQAEDAPGSVRRLWYDIDGGVTRLGDLLGVRRDLPADPDQPVLIDPPAFGGTPRPIYPSRPAGNTAAVQAADQALALVDAFTASLAPVLHRHGAVPAALASARDLRNSLARLRSLAADGGSDRDLRAAMRQAAARYRSLQSAWSAAARDPALQSPLPDRIGAALARLEAAISY